MSVHLEEHVELCAGYALGTLQEADHHRLADHLRAGCKDCVESLEEFNDALVVVARSSPPAEPPETLRAKVLADVLAFATGEVEKVAEAAQEVEIHTTTSMSWKGWLSVWGALVFAFALIMSQAEVRRVKTELAEARGLLARVSREMTEGVLWSQLVNAPGAHVALLEPAAVGAPSGWITYDNASGRAVAMIRDAHPPEGRVFVLWAVAGTRYVRMGALDSAASGNAALRVDRGKVIPGVTSFAISTEPASQVTVAPTGPIVASGKSGA